MTPMSTLRRLRLETGKSIQTVADELRISHDTLWRLETGKAQLVHELLLPLADYYQCCPLELLHDEQAPPTVQASAGARTREKEPTAHG